MTMIFVCSEENFILLHANKRPDWPVHLSSLISAFVTDFLESI